MRKQDLSPYFGGKREILRMFPAHQHRGKRRKERHIYVDNRAPVLLVAHIDTVQTPRLDRVNRGAGFDDRLGVYLGHKLVRSRPDLFDLLLTDYEETGGSTAAYFTPSHDYKLVVELDREGEDYVDYGLASSELRWALEDCGFTHQQGLFSDICMMDHVKCNKFNLGLGTHHSHSKDSGFDMGVFERQVKRLLDFVEMYKDITWPEADGKDRGWFGSVYDDDICDVCTDAQYFECESCGDPHGLDELIYDPLYDGFLCATCHYVLH